MFLWENIEVKGILRQRSSWEANVGVSWFHPYPPFIFAKGSVIRYVMTHRLVGETGQGFSPPVGRRKCHMYQVTWKHLLLDHKGRSVPLWEVRR